MSRGGVWKGEGGRALDSWGTGSGRGTRERGRRACGERAIWAGTGVGLVKEVQSAGEIVRKARQEARDILARVAKL